MPFTNPQAEQGVYNTDGTTILKGCAVVPSGGLTGRAANVSHPSGADAWFVGVAAADIPASSGGIAYQSAFSNVQVRLASNVARGDRLRVANAAGEFETAALLSQNVALVALSNGAAGSSTTWAAPIGTRPL